MTKVGITQCTTYNQDEVDRAVFKAAESCGFPSLEGKKVLLKPNVLSDAKVEKSITTNPAVLRAAIHLVKEKGATEIYVGDSPGLQNPGFRPTSCGLDRICSEENVTWVDFAKDPVTRVISYTKGKKLPQARILDEVDFVISLPKFKTHQLMYTTGAVKNMFGTVPGLHKSPCHVAFPTRDSFANCICGIYRNAHVDFAIMDAVVGMEGAGPANGHPCMVGLILASPDSFCLDAAQAIIMGHDPMEIPIIAHGKKHGLTNLDMEYPLLKAEDLVIKEFDRIPIDPKTHLFATLILPFFTRPFQKKKVQKERVAPRFESSICVLCKRCVNICPAKALTVVDRKVTIDVKKCVRCYCCHEVCPVNAIKIDEE